MSAGAEHRIAIAGGDVAFACGEGDTLLRAAQRASLGFPYECNVGSCGNCKFELLEGEVVNAWPAAPASSDKDRQRQRHLGCQSQPRSACMVKLRLGDRYAPLHRPRRGGAVLASRRSITHDIEDVSLRARHRAGRRARPVCAGLAARCGRPARLVDEQSRARCLGVPGPPRAPGGRARACSSMA